MQIERMVEQIASEKSWQTNLEPDEVKYLLRWVRRQLADALDQRKTEVRARLRTVNQMLGLSRVERPDLVKMMTDEGRGDT
jgi:hypothetical protein